jgi:molybdopterin converting factor small subunit
MQVVVSVRYYNIVADALGRREELRVLEAGATVRDLLQALATERPSFAKLALTAEGGIGGQMRPFRNGCAVLDLDEVLLDGDDLSLFPAISGG